MNERGKHENVRERSFDGRVSMGGRKEKEIEWGPGGGRMFGKERENV